MKRIAALLTAAVMGAAMLTGCGGEDKRDGKLTVVTTIFPEYDWVREIAGENGDVEIVLLTDGGIDLHSYQPTVADIAKIKECDLFIYVGGESDSWAEDLVSEPRDGQEVISLMEVLGGAAKEEELKEGMEPEEEEEVEEEGPEYDEHVWLSLRNAQLFCREIEGRLEKLDPDGADGYKENLEEYTGRLMELDGKYSEAVESAGRKTLLFGDRFPFRYLADDYGLDYYAAFAGCSAETEASFETVIFLAQKADELGIDVILTIDRSDKKLAQTIADNAASGGIEILEIDSMQGTSTGDGKTYCSVMEGDLEVLKRALGAQ